MELGWKRIFVRIHDDDDATLQARLRKALVTAIEARQIAQGFRLPSSRKLALLLGISRNTVLLAYQQLADEGTLVSRQRSGIFVGPVGAGPAPAPPPRPDHDGSPDWDALFAVRPTGFRHISKPRNHESYPYPFLFGQPDPSLFPIREWRESAKTTSSVSGIGLWAGDMVDEDDPGLIEQLRAQVLPRRGIWAAEDQVMVTLGAQQALYLVIRLLTGADTVFGLEDPGYPDSRHMVHLHTDRVQLLHLDAEGVVPDEALARCDVALVTPGHQCPTTVVMSETRRRDVLALAARNGIVLIEDDYDCALLDDGASIASLKSMDVDGRVIYVGSLSKVLAPGLRIGYVVAPAAVIAELRALRRIMLRHPPHNNQHTMASFIALGHYRTHLRRIGEVLQRRAALIDGLLPRYLPQCRSERACGAGSFWIRCPPQVDSASLAIAARAEGVLIEPGGVFHASPEHGRHCLRLGFSSIRESRIEAGLARLGAVMSAAATS